MLVQAAARLTIAVVMPIGNAIHSRILQALKVVQTMVQTPAPASKSSPVPTFTLTGIVFFDCNGNGVRDDNEPVIANATVQVGRLSAAVSSDGRYILRGVPKGTQQVRLLAPSFRYVSLSPDFIQPSAKSVSVVVDGDTRRDWGLAQGFLTLPFKRCPRFIRDSPFGMTGMFDVDRRVGHVRSYDPEQVKADYESDGKPPWVYDQHDGIDYCFVEDTEIVAAAPGIVRQCWFDKTAGNCLVIQHPYDNSQTIYAHLSQSLVAVSQGVSRGQCIGLSGNTGVSGEPHLHFGYGTWTTPPNRLDPYRDLMNLTSIGYWTVDNNPQYPS